MYPKATVSCSCGCLFQIDFQTSSIDAQPQCPQCKATMNETSWRSLRTAMAELADFNHHVVKWNLERQEPRMLVPVITVNTLEG